jgi:hypothetical protein
MDLANAARGTCLMARGDIDDSAMMHTTVARIRPITEP